VRIFLDANILFSAAKSAGAIRRLLELLLDGGHACCVDGFVVAEARRNLELKAPGGPVTLDSLLDRLDAAPMQVLDPEIESKLPLPEKDRPVLAAAIRRNCEALITGDRTHFRALYGRTIHGVKIHSPRSIAELLLR
jgi:predicted nucleic acid-binding protein